LGVAAPLHDLRGVGGDDPRLDADDYAAAQGFAAQIRAAGAQGVVYPSVRGEGECVGLFFPDLALAPQQGRHLDYHWDGARVDMIRDAGSRQVYRVEV